MKITSCKTHVVTIFIACDYQLCKQVLQKYVMKGACVSVKPCDYIYTMGLESGVEITLINYPRFPKKAVDSSNEAVKLAKMLIEELYQGSCSVVTPDETFFISRRKDD